MNTAIARYLFTLIAAFCCVLLFVVPTQAAPPLHAAQPPADRCRNNKLIQDWHSRQAIEARGFFFDIAGDQASVDFGRTMSLNLASDPSSSAYTASRITETDSDLPIAQRVKCWQATPNKNVLIEFRIRFKQAAPTPALIENLLLWNAPEPSRTRPEPGVPATAIGVSRNSLNVNGALQYQAVIAQDIPVAPSTKPFIRETRPMPAWLDASAWHSVRITLSQRSARVEVAQGVHPFTIVAQSTLLHPAEPLSLELSVDNEVRPGLTVPVKVSDSLEVSYLRMRMAPIGHNAQ